MPEGASRVTLLVYPLDMFAGSLFNDRPHISPTLIEVGGKFCAVSSTPEMEMFFVLHGYGMSL
jgi:hypothetical protein